MRCWLKRGLILALILLGLPLAVYFYISWEADRELRAVVAELDGKHAPWRWDALLAGQPPVTEADDALALVLKVDALVPASFSGNKHVDAVLGRPPQMALAPDEADKFHQVMTTAESALVAARELASMPGARLRVRMPSSVPGDMDMAALSKARAFVVLLECAAAWHAHHGKLDHAADDCFVMQRAGQTLRDELTLMPHLTRMALESMSVRSLQRVLAQGQPAPQQLERLQQAWEQFDRNAALANALRGERAWSHEWCQNLGTGRNSFDQALESQGIMSLWERIQLRHNLKEAHAWTLRQATEYLESLNLPEPQRRERQEQLAKEVGPGIARSSQAITRVLEADRRVEAQIRCAIAGIAAERFRRERACWPATLGELTPEFLKKVPADPYADQPLQLRRAGDGIVIYSVGPDGKQRGTHQEDRAAGRSSLMYEFRLWDVARRRRMP